MKRSIHALSLTPAVNNWLANSRDPRILHIFDRACNLINERREILSIVTQQIGNGPFNLMIADDLHISEHLRLESKVSASRIELHLGDLTIRAAKAMIWNPYPDWEVLHAKKGDIDDHLSQLLVINYLNTGGFVTPFGESSGLPLTQSLVSNLFSAFANANISTAKTITSQLAGLGIGLTPSGDDFLMGAIYAAWIIHPPEIASAMAQEIASTAALLTTSLSAAWLRSAGWGEAGILWHEFFDVLVSTDHTRIKEAVENILAIGETSGADALAGFTGVFASWRKEVSSHE